MSAMLQVLVATALVAGLILLRLFADRAVQRFRARVANQTHAECGRASCFRTCDRDRPTARADSAGKHNA